MEGECVSGEADGEGVVFLHGNPFGGVVGMGLDSIGRGGGLYLWEVLCCIFVKEGIEVEGGV